MGPQPLHFAANNGHAAVAQLLLAARCSIDLHMKDGLTALQLVIRGARRGCQADTERQLIRNTKQKVVRDVICRLALRRSKSSRKMLTGR